MGSQAITAGIFGVIVLVLAFILYTPLVNGMDGLILYWSDSCANDSQRYVRAYYAPPTGTDFGTSASNVYDKSEQRYYGSGLAVTASGSNCQIATGNISPSPSAATTTGELVNERGITIANDAEIATTGVVSAITDLGNRHTWTSVPSLMTQFGGIGKLILSVMPIVVLVTYLGTAGMGLVEYGRGLSSGGIVNAVGGSVLSLIVQVVILQVLPTVLDAIVGSARVTGGQYTVTSTFSSVINIVFAAIPILLVVALLGTSGFQFQRKLSKFRGSGAMNMMGG